MATAEPTVVNSGGRRLSRSVEGLEQADEWVAQRADGSEISAWDGQGDEGGHGSDVGLARDRTEPADFA